MKKIVFFILSIAFLFFQITPIYADSSLAATTSSYGLGCGGNMGPLADFFCGSKTTEEVGNKLNSILSSIVGFLTAIAGLWFFLQFILAGIAWISAGGDKSALETARNKIFNSVIGLIIVVSAYILVAVVGSMLGLNILNPGEILQNLGI